MKKITIPKSLELLKEDPKNEYIELDYLIIRVKEKYELINNPLGIEDNKLKEKLNEIQILKILINNKIETLEKYYKNKIKEQEKFKKWRNK